MGIGPRLGIKGRSAGLAVTRSDLAPVGRRGYDRRGRGDQSSPDQARGRGGHLESGNVRNDASGWGAVRRTG